LIGVIFGIVLSLLTAYAITPTPDGAPGDGILLMGLGLVFIPLGIAILILITGTIRRKILRKDFA